ncbi:MAG: hypothetical protein HY248_02315, partial [Fimbriimonas ginsengisoli]|nr:hypothetical protein [Fimbriimonas ginsengisoli]
MMLLPALAFAQRSNAVPAFRMAQPPTIDGVIDTENEWKDAPKFEGMLDATTSAMSQESATFWLAYDRKFIYFAARMGDSKPNAIEATNYRSNVPLDGDDRIVLSIDPFGVLTEDSFNKFTINPRGASFIEIAGGRAAKREWLGEMLAAGRITETGWEVEARIPWKVMRLPRAGRHELRFNVTRYLRRTIQQFVWQYTDGGKPQNYGRLQAPELPDTTDRTVKLLPYTFTGWDHDNGRVTNAGLDMRTPITSTLDFVGSANPDFRNVENAILSLEFSYFARLVDESRPFFLEGQQYFTTSRDAPLFASQQIDRFDIGTKIAGKLDDKTDLGILNALSYGSQNAFAGKFRRQLTPRSWFEGGYVGLRQHGIGNDGTFMQYHREFGPYTFFAQQTTTRDTEMGYGHRYNTGVAFGKNGLSGSTEYVEISDEYLGRLGFAPETGIKGYTAYIEKYRPIGKGPILDTDAGVNAHFLRTM